MSDQLPPFPDVAGRAAQETVPPPFERVVTRARRRRRRGVLAAVASTAAAVAVVAAGAAQTKGHPDTAPPPTEPSPSRLSPSPPSAANETIARGGVADVGLDGAGNLLTVWSTCLKGSDADACDYAWKLTTKHSTRTGVLPSNHGVRVVTANGAFVLAAWDGGGLVVSPDGSTHPLRRADAAPLSPGDVLVDIHRRVAVVQAQRGTWRPLTGPNGGGLASGLVDGDTIWAQETLSGPTPGATVVWTTDGHDWHEHKISGQQTTPGPVTAVGNHVAASSGRVADDYNPLAEWSTSTDSGTTWTDLPADQLPFRDVDEMTPTPNGTLYVHSALDGLFRSTDPTWRHFEKVPGRWLVSALQQVSTGVAMLQWEHHSPVRLVVLDDAGHSNPVKTFD
jgi:hypothetical protein